MGDFASMVAGGAAMLVQTDSRRRVTLPTSCGVKPGDAIEIELLEDGRILLVPVAAIPKHQLWAWTPEVRQAIQDSLADPAPSIEIETPGDLQNVMKRWPDEG
jgi:hypothetical protein